MAISPSNSSDGSTIQRQGKIEGNYTAESTSSPTPMGKSCPLGQLFQLDLKSAVYIHAKDFFFFFFPSELGTRCIQFMICIPSLNTTVLVYSLKGIYYIANTV